MIALPQKRRARSYRKETAKKYPTSCRHNMAFA
jgi:hypothetical protein